MAVGAMIFPFLLYLLLLRNDQLVYDLAYRMMLLYGVLCRLLLLRSSSGRQKLLLLHLFVLKVVEEGDGNVVGEKRSVGYRCPLFRIYRIVKKNVKVKDGKRGREGRERYSAQTR
jgi:hypothetical protein